MVLKKHSYRWLVPIRCSRSRKRGSKYSSLFAIMVESPQNKRSIVHSASIGSTWIWANRGEVFRFAWSQPGSKIICRWHGSSSSCESIVNLLIIDRRSNDSTEKARWKRRNARREEDWIGKVGSYSSSDDIELKGNMNDRGSKMHYYGTFTLLLFWAVN